MLSAAATDSGDAPVMRSAERERLLNPGVLVYSATCSGIAASVGGLLAFLVAAVLHSRGLAGVGWALTVVLSILLVPAAVAAIVVTCALLLPLHYLLVRLQLRSHIFYQAAMLAIVFASYYVVTAGQEWSLAFTIPFAAVPGAMVFRHFAYTIRPVPHGWPEALIVFLWAAVIAAQVNLYLMIGRPPQTGGEVYKLWIMYGMPAMTLLAMTALYARAWSRRTMAALSCVGLALPVVFSAAALAAPLLPRLAANECWTAGAVDRNQL